MLRPGQAQARRVVRFLPRAKARAKPSSSCLCVFVAWCLSSPQPSIWNIVTLRDQTPQGHRGSLDQGADRLDGSAAADWRNLGPATSFWAMGNSITKTRRHEGTKAQRHKGTKAQRHKGTKKRVLIPKECRVWLGRELYLKPEEPNYCPCYAPAAPAKFGLDIYYKLW